MEKPYDMMQVKTEKNYTNAKKNQNKPIINEKPIRIRYRKYVWEEI